MSDRTTPTSGSSSTAPTSSMWSSSFPKGKDPRQQNGGAKK